ncbi:MAG TPA: hypothetical protein VE991_11535, partial [Acidimicrobiales bacterium]|nr:hypothetical protein [Acidimicrobiales bacterium]
FTDYGCGTMTNCLTQRVAASQGGSLDLLAANTNYYVLSATNACQYVKSTDRYTTVNVSGSQNGALVTGHFGWDGTQWQFFVTNFITPPPAATCSNSYGPLTAIASIAESTTGTPQGSGFTGSQWQGTVTNGDAGNTFLGGPVTMTLDWTPDPSVGAWDFSGTYKVAGANGSNNSVSGAVDGAIAPNGAVNANLTITSITGQFAGRTGYGTLTGSASPTPDAHQGPPSFFNVTFSWITQNG